MTANDAFKKRLKRREDMFLRRLFGILAKMAKADGKVDAWEVHAAEGAFARFPRAAARRAFCKGVFNSSKDGRSSVCRLAEEFASSWARPDDCFAVYELLWDIACAKGVLNPTHKEILRTVCAPLKLPEPYFGIFYRKRRPTFREITPEEASGANGRQGRTAGGPKNARESSNRRRRPSPPPPRQKTPLEKAYELLKCRSSDANDVVRRAYRAAAKTYHPDMLRASSASEAQIKKATEMMAKINSAWDLIKESRGL